MYRYVLPILLLFAIPVLSYAQKEPAILCGQKPVTEKLLRDNPLLKQYQQRTEQQLQDYNNALRSGKAKLQRTTAIVTLPIVVHIIHNNGIENISDAQVLTGIQHLNEAFANTGYYDPADGVNTQIQFCLAQRDPNGNATNGITRNVSAYTVMGGADPYFDDLNVKNLNRWNPGCYINIWIVRSIPGSVAGYAYLPSVHGLNVDGIVMESVYFGSSPANSTVTIHEMGHYLGLYHTFEGSCKNDDCTVDGDKVCDTPPDQSTAFANCATGMNSCSTDNLSGFATDVNDLVEDYMDYGNLNCMKVFTQGQADRMNWHIQQVRSSLLNCKSCLSPCPAPITAGFTPSATNVTAGTLINFVNSSVNAAGFEWSVNNVLQATTTSFSYTFNAAGTYTVKLRALSGNPLCNSEEKTVTITVSCPVTAAFTPSAITAPPNTNISFTNGSSGATSYTWYINDVQQATTTHLSHTFVSGGFYKIKLIAASGACRDSITQLIRIKDPCNEYTFRKSYGGAGIDVAHDVRPTADGGYIIAGSTSASGSEAFLLKLDNQGNVTWINTYGGPGADLFKKVIVTSDGGYLAVGQTRSYGYTTGAVMVVKTDAAGMEEWHQYYGEKSVNGEIGNGVTATADGGYAIAGSQNAGIGTTANMLVFKIDATGSLQWSRVYGTANTDHATDIIEDNGDLIVAGYSASGTAYQDGVLMKLNAAGTLQWTKMYDIGFQNSYMSTQIYRQGNQYLVTMPTYNDLTLTNGRRLYACKIDLQGNLQSVVVAGSGNTPNASNEQAIPLPDGGLMTIQVSPGAVNSGLQFMKTDAAGNLEWGKRHVDPALQETRALRQTADGGFISVGSINTGGNTDIYVVKTDAIANIPSCLVVPGASGNPLNYFSTTTLNWTTNRNASFPLTPASLVMGQLTIAANTICAYSTPCSVPDSCTQHSSFRKTYATPGTEVTKDIAGLLDGHYIIAGEMTAPGRTDVDAVLIKINIYGDTLWTKRFGGQGNDGFLRVKQSSDGSIYAVGYTRSFGTPQSAAYVVKTDNNGNLIFYNTIGGNSPNGDIANDMAENRGGTLIITGVHNTGPASDMFVADLNTSGWGTYMYVFDNGGEEAGTGITAVNDSVMITGYMSSQYYHDAFVVKWNTSFRSHIWSRKFDRLQGNDAFDRIYKTGTGFLVNNSYSTDFSNNGFKHGIVQLDLNGNITNAWTNTTATVHNGPHSLAPTIDGGFAVVESEDNVNSDVYLYKFDANGNRQMGRQFSQPNRENMHHLVQHDDGSYLLAGVAATPSDIFVIKTDIAGNTAGCTTDSSAALLSSSPMTVQSFTWGSITNISNFPNAETRANLWTAPVVTSALCKYAPCEVPDTCDTYPCDTVFVTGTDTTCVLSGNAQVYTAHRNANCTAPITWTVDPAYADIIATTDATIELRFKKAGSVMLYAEIPNDCRIIKDSLKIYLFASPTAVDLGPDRQLCQVSTSVLRAGAGFQYYRWQDGSTDSTFTAYNTGTYHVAAYDYCGNVYKDTIVISQAPAVPFDLGPDLLLCEKDTVAITAPAGFTNYRWSANYKVNSIYGQTIKIYTDIDTLYSVTAERSPGCIVTDTIRIALKKAPPVDLGIDTSFCRGATLTLDAGPGFDSYRWNTLATTQQITVQAPGSYRVAALYANGCYARDTVEVSRYDMPSTILTDTATFCDFSNATLTPLMLNDFIAYQWSTGATTPVVRIDRPGLYWVQVTHRNGCIGTDTILVTKRSCGNKLYIPNAFTPNNDHHNDVFKPAVDGQLVSFRLAVFSRWGEKIFETTNATLGWRGDWKNKPMDTGSYVWICTYQFAGAGQPVQTSRGIVTLLR
ncbi:M43 family zinc metalloprotease [Paraflavitalea soli]|nr:M43 family zinc metalloprotease [Paraflavitalea soli]